MRQQFTPDLVQQQFYFDKKLKMGGWSKENVLRSIWDRMVNKQLTDGIFQSFYEFIDWLYSEIFDLTTTAYVKEAFSNVVIYYHNVKNENTQIQLGCINCERMTDPLHFLSQPQRVHHVMYAFFSPYLDREERERVFMNLLRRHPPQPPPLPAGLLLGATFSISGNDMSDSGSNDDASWVLAESVGGTAAWHTEAGDTLSA